MITYLTALYAEAKPLIQTLGLKQNSSETQYALFEGEDCCLLITGSGMISAATSAARHFALHPAGDKDLFVNLGIAGYVPSDAGNALPSVSAAACGDCFLVSKITDKMTGRTFYPDILYRNSFRKLPLSTVAAPSSDASLFEAHSLVDMEASALYQALLPHISPERMFFFKIISDIIGQTKSVSALSAEQVTELVTPHGNSICSFARKLHDVLSEPTAAASNLLFSDEEQSLMETVYEKLPLTESTRREVHRLFRYVKLTGTPLSGLLKDFLAVFPETPVRGKKQAAPYLERLHTLVLEQAPFHADGTASVLTGCHLPFYEMVYVEKSCQDVLPSSLLKEEVILIDHYKDIFNRSHQNFAEQKKAPSLIFAKKTGTLIYEGAPVCQSFGNEHFYYTSCMMNCVYHCDYCYLQGMYPSGHTVVFVNLEDYFNELEALLAAHPVYLCISYDTDLLALEHRFGFVKRWLTFAAAHEDLTLEIRTKSGNPAIFAELAKLYTAASVPAMQTAKKRIIFAWTLSPECVIRTSEHGTASLALRLQALVAARDAGFSVRVCFDPMIYHSGWKNSYKELVKSVFNFINPADLYDVSLGVFRISTDYLKTMRKKRPDSAIVQFPYITEHGVSHYGKLSEEMIAYLKALLLSYLPAEKIFEWNGGN